MIGNIAATAICCPLVAAASLGPSQVMGMGMLAYSAGETAFLLTKITYAALRNFGKHKVNDRKDYQNYNPNHHYTLADKSYFKMERMKDESLWLKTVTFQRFQTGSLAMLPFVGIVFMFFHGHNSDEAHQDFWRKSKIGTIDRILEDIENPNRA